jgi:hypothetical protein
MGSRKNITSQEENTLFPLEEGKKKKRSIPYKGYKAKKEKRTNKSLWAELYPEPKRTVVRNGDVF